MDPSIGQNGIVLSGNVGGRGNPICVENRPGGNKLLPLLLRRHILPAIIFAFPNRGEDDVEIDPDTGSL